MQALARIVTALILLGCLQASATASTKLTQQPLITGNIGRTIHFEDRQFILVGDMLFRRSPPGMVSAWKDTWDNGELVYAFNGNVTSTNRDTFRYACAAWALGTPLRCTERTTQSTFVYVSTHNGAHCGGEWSSCSEVGQVGGHQDLFVYNGHWSWPHVIQHEIGHALGFIHEHQRFDRDNYIYVHRARVAYDAEFDVIVKDFAEAQTEYDYRSIMHYDTCQGSRHQFDGCSPSTPHLWAMEALSCGITQLGGYALTPLDKDGARRAYAPALAKLWGEKRSGQCGRLAYKRSTVEAGCNGLCLDAESKIDWFRQITLTDKACGSWVPVTWGTNLCSSLGGGREQYSLDRDSDPFSCGLVSEKTLFEVTAVCACPVANFEAKCLSGNTNTLTAAAFPAELRYVGQFLTAVQDRVESESLSPQVGATIDDIIFENANDPELKKKLKKLMDLVGGDRLLKIISCPSVPTGRTAFDILARRAGLRVTRPELKDEPGVYCSLIKFDINFDGLANIM